MHITGGTVAQLTDPFETGSKQSAEVSIIQLCSNRNVGLCYVHADILSLTQAFFFFLEAFCVKSLMNYF